MRKQGGCLEKATMQGTVPGARRRGRPRTAWIDNIKTWAGLSVEESIRMTEDRDKRRKYVHGVANPRIKDGNRTEHKVLSETTYWFRQYRYLENRSIRALDDHETLIGSHTTSGRVISTAGVATTWLNAELYAAATVAVVVGQPVMDPYALIFYVADIWILLACLLTYFNSAAVASLM